MRERGVDAPRLGPDWGLLSEMAHSTRDAAENSAALLLWERGINEYGQTVIEAITALEREVSSIMYRLIWLVLHEDSALGVSSDRRQQCSKRASIRR